MAINSNSTNIQVFTSKLVELVRDDPGSRHLPALFVAAEGLRSGSIDDSELQNYKALAIAFVREGLESSEEKVQDAFFLFILRSNLISEIPALRTEMLELIRRHLTSPVNALISNATAALLRSRKPPSATAIKLVFPRAKQAFDQQPAWLLVPILVEAARWHFETNYTTDDLVTDVSKLRDGANFEEAVSLRNSIWQSLEPPTDAIAILTQANSSKILRHPPISKAQENAFAKFTGGHTATVAATVQ